MAHKDGSKSGGRQKGTPNKKAVERAEKTRIASEKIDAALRAAGISQEEISALDYLRACYRCPDLPARFRADAAKAALQFETPKIATADPNRMNAPQYIAVVPAQCESVDEWLKMYGPGRTHAAETQEEIERRQRFKQLADEARQRAEQNKKLQ